MSYRLKVTYKDLLTRHARLLPAVTDLVLVQVACRGINVTVSTAKSMLNSRFDLIRLGKLFFMD